MPEFKTPLCELAYQYGSDKCSQVKHFYTEYYYQAFLPIQNWVRTVLEIGIGDAEEMAWTKVPHYQAGASLRMWRDFFPKAQVYGADIKSIILNEPRITTFQCDQADESALRSLVEKTGTHVDIVIDDGSHRAEHQVFTCRTLMPLLWRDVIYIIEDAGHPEIVNALPEYNCHIIRRSRMRFKDDRLILVQKKRRAKWGFGRRA